MNKNLTQTFQVVKDIELVKDFSATTKATDGLWFVASAEMVDSAGDVVIRDGISYDDYHQPPTRYMKILAGHNTKTLADGSAPVIGRVEQFAKGAISVDGKSVAALFAYMSWATEEVDKPLFNADGTPQVDEKGLQKTTKVMQLASLAGKYKALYDQGYLESFSVGMLYDPTEATKNKSGGINVNSSKLYEISAVAVPMLTTANAIKAIKDILGEEIEPDTFIRHEKDGSQWVSKEAHEKIVKEVSDKVYAQKQIIEGAIADAIAKAIVPLTTSVNQSNDGLKGIVERLDVLESAIVVLTDSAKGQKSDNAKNDPATKEHVKQITDTLDKLNRFFE